MNPFHCAREREVTEQLRRGYWPDASSPELRAHVESCRICSDVVLLTRVFAAARAETTPKVRLESAGALRWRAQLRRRYAAIEAVGRPILGAQVFALAVSLVVAAAVLVWQGSTLKAWFSDLPRALHLDALMPGAISQSGMWVVLPVLATAVLLGGVVVYLATEKQ
jgi:hypothetical protein